MTDNIIFTYEITWLLVVTRGYSYKSVVGHRNINGYSCVNVDKDVFNLYLAFLKQQMIINLSKRWLSSSRIH